MDIKTIKKEIESLQTELRKLRAEKVILETYLKKGDGRIEVLDSDISKLRDGKAILLDKQKEQQKKLSALKDDVRSEEGKLRSISKETGEKIAETKECQRHLDEETKTFEKKESKFEKDKKKEKGRVVEADKRDSRAKLIEENNTKNKDKLLGDKVQLDKDCKKLLKEEESIDVKVEEAIANVEKTKELRVSAKEKESEVEKSLAVQKEKERVLAISQAELDMLVETNNKLVDEAEERVKALDVEKESQKAAYADIDKKNQEVELKRLKLLKIAKEKDLQKQIKELEKEGE